MGLGTVSLSPWPRPYIAWVVFSEAWGEVKGWRCGRRAVLGSITYASHLGSAGWLKFGQRLGALGKFPGTLGAAGVRAPGTRGQDRLTLLFCRWLPPRRRALARC